MDWVEFARGPALHWALAIMLGGICWRVAVFVFSPPDYDLYWARKQFWLGRPGRGPGMVCGSVTARGDRRRAAPSATRRNTSHVARTCGRILQLRTGNAGAGDRAAGLSAPGRRRADATIRRAADGASFQCRVADGLAALRATGAPAADAAVARHR